MRLACLAALFLAFTACAQVGTVDHDWCLHRGIRRYGMVQVTYPGPTSSNNTYTYLYLGKAERRVHAPAPLLAAAVLGPLAVLVLLRIGPRGLSRTGGGPDGEPTNKRD